MFRPQDLPELEISPGLPIPATEDPSIDSFPKSREQSSSSTFNTVNPVSSEGSPLLEITGGREV